MAFNGKITTLLHIIIGHDRTETFLDRTPSYALQYSDRENTNVITRFVRLFFSFGQLKWPLPKKKTILLKKKHRITSTRRREGILET